jgi:aromatic ring-cleaving dioxygenase
MVSFSSLAASLLLAAGVQSHPDSSSRGLKDTMDCAAYPPIMSYHVHITYMLTNKDQIAEATALRDVAQKEFSQLLGPDYKCAGTPADSSGRYDNGKLCMIYDHELDITLGPFPIGEWSMFVPVHYYNRVVPWFVRHRGEFSLLVHPNTGCEYEDHGAWAQWSGDKWNMDFSIFTEGTQTESFNQTLGTLENPSCLADIGSVCAAPSSDQIGLGYAPQVVCCNGLACQCGASQEDLCYCK